MTKKKSTRKSRSGAAAQSDRPDAALVRRARRIYRALQKQYPKAECALHHRDPWQLLVATILSAQCTDERVNMVTPALFAKYPDPAAMAAAKSATLEKLIRSTGFYRNKTKSLLGTARSVTERHNGSVPDTMDELLELPGVARKTANCVLGNAFGKNEGIVVDTHVKRLAGRMGFTSQTDPVKIERDLMPLFERENWALLAHLLIWHGRATCNARKPDCDHCCVAKDCPKIGVA